MGYTTRSRWRRTPARSRRRHPTTLGRRIRRR